MRILYRRLRQCAYYNFNNQLIFACHAGISKMPKELSLLSTKQLIYGCGSYSEMKQVCDNWERENSDIIQVFGHRNIEGLPINVNSCCYNLERWS